MYFRECFFAIFVKGCNSESAIKQPHGGLLSVMTDTEDASSFILLSYLKIKVNLLVRMIH